MRILKFALAIAGMGLLSGFNTLVRAANAPSGQTLFVANANNNTIENFNASGAGVAFANAGLGGPDGLAVDTSGNLFVANSYVGYTGYSIEEFSPSGVGKVFAGPSTGLDQPTGLAFSSTGNLFVADAGNDTIQEFNSLGVGMVIANTELNAPTALAFNSAGTLFVANGNGNNIVEFNSGVGTVFANSGVSSPTGMAFNAVGDLFVASQDGAIEEYNASGSGHVFARLPTGETPVGVAFDSAGDLFATTSYNTIVEFNSSGTGTVFANSGLNEPAGLVFVAVPESPASALFAAAMGAGAVLAQSCRRKFSLIMGNPLRRSG
jgi:WD40 repeat protein